MRRLSGVLVLASFGLVAGCGDDNMNTSATTTASTTMGTLTTLTTVTDSSTGMTMGTGTDTASTAPTSTDSGTGSTTDTGTSGPTTGTTDTTGMVMTTTMGPTTDPMTSTTNMSSTGSTTDTPCQELMVTLEPVKPNTMLVLDKSGSMLQMWDHDANANTPTVTRWFSLYAVVNQILTDFNDKFNFGMNLFPSTMAQSMYNSQACLVNDVVEVPVAAMNKDPILAVLPAQNNMTIAGGTPTAKGMTAALNHLKSLDPAIPQAVILITDGAANCSTSAMNVTDLFEVYDANLAGIVGDAFTMDNIPTYVIGIAISNALTGNQQDGNPNAINPYDKLNELATLGGTAKMGAEKFYSADNQIELSDALNAIVGAAFSCVIELEAPPAFPDKTIVKVGGVEIPKIADCANGNGWTYIEPMPYGAIELCGTACDDLKIAGDADVEYYCDAG